jgi:hypothetical protein
MTEDIIGNLNINTNQQAYKTRLQMHKFRSNEEKLNEYTFFS